MGHSAHSYYTYYRTYKIYGSLIHGWASNLHASLHNTSAPPNVPQNVQAPTEFIQSTSMLLTWQSPTTDNSSQSISYYQVTCDPGAHTYTPSNTSQWVTDLQPYTKYNCCVSIYTCNVTGEMSGDCINITTLEAGLYN